MNASPIEFQSPRTSDFSILGKHGSFKKVYFRKYKNLKVKHVKEASEGNSTWRQMADSRDKSLSPNWTDDSVTTVKNQDQIKIRLMSEQDWRGQTV